MLNSVTVGLDYVGHEDILPFSANSEEPFQHDMLNQFFSNSIVNEGTIMHGNTSILSPLSLFSDKISSWQLQNTPWLEHMIVHKETTHNIRITIIPFYIGYRVSYSYYFV